MDLNYFPIFIVAFYIIFFDSTEACGHYCETYIYKPYIERYKFLSRLPHSRQLNTLALIGTHSSLFNGESAKQLRTQDLTIGQQLKYGVRVLDIGLRLRPNILDTLSDSDSGPANGDFFDLLIAINDFLAVNPGELIIMLVWQIEPPRKDLTKSDCEILDFYIRHVEGGSRIVRNWKFNDTIGQHRGRILIGRLDYIFQECVVDVYDKCKLKDYPKLFTRRGDYSVRDKGVEILEVIHASVKNKYECLIHDISYYDGKNSRQVTAKDSGIYYDGSCYRPINDLVANVFSCPNKGLKILIVDYMTIELSDVVNDCNFLNSSWRIGWE